MTDPADNLAIASDDADYFRARAADERRRIQHAASIRARRIHREMAEHYETLARLLDHQPCAEAFSLARAVRGMLTRLHPR
jgi:hypothetical protein